MTKFISQVFCFGPESTDELDGFPYRSKEQIFFDFPNTFPSWLNFYKINSHTFKDIVTIFLHQRYLVQKMITFVIPKKWGKYMRN